MHEVPRRIDAGERRICVTSPTGSGKTVTICDLIEWALDRRWEAILYTNRRLLIEQLRRVLRGRGFDFGVRAAGHAEELEQPVQVSSLPTERSRTINSTRWIIHGHGGKLLAIVDEAHLNKSGTAQTILQRHYDAGHVYCGFTATPIDLAHLYDSLVIAGTPTQMRQCGALVSAYHYGPDEPDMHTFRQSTKTGEYVENDVRKAIMTPTIFGRVLGQFHQLNPERNPTILFGPGVNESIWFAEQFSAQGIRAAHIDGEGYWLDGEYRRTTDPEERHQLLEDLRAGGIKVLCNRYVAREGLDLPEVSHLILATVMGSLQTYLQSVGRGLRAAPGKDRCTIQDHGGHYWRHGSVNADREWHLNYTESLIAEARAERFRSKESAEPIRCPQCGLVRASGPRCPGCGHECSKRSRMVIQTDGTLREHVGDIFRPRVVKSKPDTSKLWETMYYRAKNSRTRMTFNQAQGLFVREHHYWPPHDLPLMPTTEFDWHLPVADVPRHRLIPKVGA
jgi:superfamily II DNA or RNA helicase